MDQGPELFPRGEGKCQVVRSVGRGVGKGEGNKPVSSSNSLDKYNGKVGSEGREVLEEEKDGIFLQFNSRFDKFFSVAALKMGNEQTDIF